MKLASRAQIADLVNAVVNETIGIVAGVTGRTQRGAESELELLLLPIGPDGRTRIRAVGILAPLVPPYGSARNLSWSSNCARYAI